MSGWDVLKDNLMHLLDIGALTSSYGWSEQFIDDIVLKTHPRDCGGALYPPERPATPRRGSRARVVRIQRGLRPEVLLTTWEEHAELTALRTRARITLFPPPFAALPRAGRRRGHVPSVVRAGPVPACLRAALVVNTGDDPWHYGLRVCPDLGTVLYGARDLATHLLRTGLLPDGHGLTA